MARSGKKLSWLGGAALVAVLAVPLTARAEEEGIVREHSLLKSAWNNGITAMPVDPFSGMLNVEYERALTSSFSAFGGMNVSYFRGLLTNETGRIAVGPETGIRAYIYGRAPAGVWLGPYVNAAWVRHLDGASTINSVGYSVGGMAGANLLVGQFVASLGAGLGWHDYSARNAVGTRIGSYGVTPRLRVALGAVF